MWLGVVTAVVLCIAVGIGLEFLTHGLPQREQEMLECVIAAVAVVVAPVFWPGCPVPAKVFDWPCRVGAFASPSPDQAFSLRCSNGVQRRCIEEACHERR